jgi:hypothetical protein
MFSAQTLKIVPVLVIKSMYMYIINKCTYDWWYQYMVLRFYYE